MEISLSVTHDNNFGIAKSDRFCADLKELFSHYNVYWSIQVKLSA